MCRGKAIRNLFSAFVMGVYLFAALFSQNFHYHPTSLSKFSTVYDIGHDTIQTDVVHSSGCLGCHFLHTGNADFPDQLALKIYSAQEFKPEINNSQLQFVAVSHAAVLLRGPPLDFI